MIETASTRSALINAGKFRVIQGVSLVVAAVWTAVTLGFDYSLALAAWHQWRATGYATVAGEITRSELEEDDRGDSRSFHPVLGYRYLLDGRQYSGDRYDYNSTWWSDAHAHRIVVANPLGRRVDVHYDPRNPADAVLHAGIAGDDLFKILFLVPLNIVMLALASAIAGAIYRGIVRPPAGGAKTWTDGRCIHVRLPGWHPLMAAGAVAVALSVTGLIVFGTSLVESTPPALLALLGAMLAGGAGVYIYLEGKVARGDCDLVIDAADGAVLLPRTMGRRSTASVPIEYITAVELDQIENRDSDGVTSYRFAPVLVLDGGERREKLVAWWDRFAAEELADWLRATLTSARGASARAT
jgi:hypothetical protein